MIVLLFLALNTILGVAIWAALRVKPTRKTGIQPFVSTAAMLRWLHRQPMRPLLVGALVQNHYVLATWDCETQDYALAEVHRFPALRSRS